VDFGSAGKIQQSLCYSLAPGRLFMNHTDVFQQSFFEILEEIRVFILAEKEDVNGEVGS